jgi:hypothetical protein
MNTSGTNTFRTLVGAGVDARTATRIAGQQALARATAAPTPPPAPAAALTQLLEAGIDMRTAVAIAGRSARVTLPAIAVLAGVAAAFAPHPAAHAGGSARSV